MPKHRSCDASVFPFAASRAFPAAVRDLCRSATCVCSEDI